MPVLMERRATSGLTRYPVAARCTEGRKAIEARSTASPLVTSGAPENTPLPLASSQGEGSFSPPDGGRPALCR
jgi:hypothetical protein